METAITQKDIRAAVRLALWAALIAVGAFLAIPIGPVPITLQTFFVNLAGFKEGPRAFWAPVLYLLAGIVGLPVFAGGVSGPAILWGPSAGFALTFPILALVAGFATRGAPTFWKFFFYGALANIINLLFGAVGLHINLNLSYPMSFSMLIPFLPGNLIKLVAACFLMMGVWKIFPSKKS
ncbi:MAG: biotin transporter BioY [Deltaproteobacteria bacterium]|jgi:biotin transport system substrate-specific component|nr:biotin transporter BioY [Deltaproteobacteria bacterium]